MGGGVGCAKNVVAGVDVGKRCVDGGGEFVDTDWVCDGDSKVSWAGHVSPASDADPNTCTNSPYTQN